MESNTKNTSHTRLKLAQRLKPKHLTLLTQLKRYASLSKVAALNGVSQPAITKALLELEDLCGGKLFQRSGRGLIPTALGSLAILKASHLSQELDNWESELVAVKEGRSGRLCIGAIPYVSGNLLAEVVSEFHLRYNAVVSIRHATSDVLVKALEARELDCMLGRASGLAGNNDLWHEALYTQTPVLIAHETLAKRLAHQTLDWKKLAEFKWMLPASSTPVGLKMAEIFLQAHVRMPTPIIETYSIDVMHGVLSKQADTLSVVPEDIAYDLVKRGSIGIIPGQLNWELPPISLIRRVRSERSLLEQQFAELLHELCRAYSVSLA